MDTHLVLPIVRLTFSIAQSDEEVPSERRQVLLSQGNHTNSISSRTQTCLTSVTWHDTTFPPCVSCIVVLVISQVPSQQKPTASSSGTVILSHVGRLALHQQSIVAPLFLAPKEIIWVFCGYFGGRAAPRNHHIGCQTPLDQQYAFPKPHPGHSRQIWSCQWGVWRALDEVGKKRIMFQLGTLWESTMTQRKKIQWMRLFKCKTFKPVVKIKQVMKLWRKLGFFLR